MTNPAEAGSVTPLPIQLRTLAAILKAGVFDNRNKYHHVLNEAADAIEALTLHRGGAVGDPLGYITAFDASFLKEKFAGQAQVIICQKPQNKKAIPIYTQPPAVEGE